MADLQSSNILGNSFTLPRGTTAQRPSSPQVGMIRYNTQKSQTEWYNGGGWQNGAGWVVQTGNTSPSYDPRVLIQIGASSFENGSDGDERHQRIWLEGTQVLNSGSPRSYRLTKLRQNSYGFWTYVTSGGYDVYGNATSANQAQDFLEGFNVGEMLILNTWDEPFNRTGQLDPTLMQDFGARVDNYSGQRDFRDMRLLVSIKGAGAPILEEHRQRYSPAIVYSLWLP